MSEMQRREVRQEVLFSGGAVLQSIGRILPDGRSMDNLYALRLTDIGESWRVLYSLPLADSLSLRGRVESKSQSQGTKPGLPRLKGQSLAGGVTSTTARQAEAAGPR